MANGNEFREYMKIVNRSSGNSAESHLSEEQMLVYCRGEMSAADRESAQSHLLKCDQCIALFRNARDFLEPQRADDEEITANETDKAWQSLWEQVRVEPSTSVRSTATRVVPLSFGRPRDLSSVFASRRSLAIAAALLISVGAFGWQTWRLRREQQLRLQSEEIVARLENSRRELEQQVSELQQSGGDQLKLERERRVAVETERDQLQARLNAREQASPNIPVFVARLSSERGAEDDIRLRFSGATEAAMLRLIIAKPYQFPRYTIELSDSRGKIVQKVSDLRPTGSDGALGFRVNRPTLRAGKYTLALFGQQGNTRQLLGEHDLSVSAER